MDLSLVLELPSLGIWVLLIFSFFLSFNGSFSWCNSSFACMLLYLSPSFCWFFHNSNSLVTFCRSFSFRSSILFLSASSSYLNKKTPMRYRTSDNTDLTKLKISLFSYPKHNVTNNVTILAELIKMLENACETKDFWSAFRGLIFKLFYNNPKVQSRNIQK